MKRAEQTEFKSVAKRYAQALIELCESNSVSKQEILKDIKCVAESLENSPDLINLMNTPNVVKSEKQNVVDKIFTGKVNKITMNFLGYLIEKDRFNILSSIKSELQAQLDIENNFVQIEVVSAIELDDGAKSSMKERLCQKLNKQVSVDWSVDSDIIGGLVFIIGDSIIDTSLKSKLQMIGRNIIK